MSNDLLHEIKRLKKKAEQNRQMHFSICRRSKIWNRIIHCLVLIGSSVTAILTFAEYEVFLPLFPTLTDNIYKLIIGVFAGFVFILTILEEYLRLGEKAASHETIGKQLTTFIRTASALEAQESITQDDLDKLVSEYSTIHDHAPIIPDRIFLREKQRLGIKIDISKKLDHTPHMSIWLYRIIMKYKQIIATCKNKNIDSVDGDGQYGQR
mgnify:CR=1 FL=1